MNELVFNQPLETGTIRAEFFGDTEKAKDYITAGRKILGAVRTFNGVNQRIAEGEAGGFYRHLAQLEDGTQIEVLTNNGMDTVRIYAVPAHEPIILIPETEIKKPIIVKALPILKEYDESNVDFSIWLLFSYPNINKRVLKKWSFGNGFSGEEILLSLATRGILIFDGWLWAVDLFSNGAYSDSIYRLNINTGEKQELHNHLSAFPEGAHTAASTVTPLGVLFVVGRVYASLVLIDAKGSVIYDAPISAGSSDNNVWVGFEICSFINDGTTAYLHYIESGGGSLHGFVSINIANGVNATKNYAIGEGGAYAAIHNKNMYGIQFASNNSPPYEPTEIFTRFPGDSESFSVLLDISSYFPDPDGYSNIKKLKGAVTQTDDSIIVMATGKNLTVIDTISNSISIQTVYGLWGLEFDDFDGEYPLVNKGAAIIPNSALSVLFFNNSDVAGLKNALGQLVTLNPTSNETTKYSFEYAYGYLTQIEISQAINPDPSLPPPKEEWEYLSATNVNPI